MPHHPDRHFRFENIRNFRDFGGYAIQGSGNGPGKVRRGRLFRSAHFAEASEGDLQRLASLGATAIADLRRPDERAREPNRLPAQAGGPEMRVIHSGEGPIEHAPWTVFVRAGNFSLPAIREFMIGTYRDLPFDSTHIALYREWLLELANDTGPAIIHCAAGKDRTGFGVALTLGLLGVGWADIMADYLLTNQVLEMDGGPSRIRKKLGMHLVGEASDEAVLLFAGVRADYLLEAMTRVEEMHGSLEGYATDVLHIDPSTQARLRAVLCEP